MDWGSLAGLVIALAGLVLGQTIEGGHLKSLMQPAAFAVVVLGTVGAVLLQTELKLFIKGVRMLRWVFVRPQDDRQKLAIRINQWSLQARKESVLSLENLIHRERDPFVRKGLQLLVDGTPADRIREVCAIDMYYFEAQERDAIKVWSAAGGYAPTVGILGAVLGLIHVMENLSDPAKIGSGIAVAFVATIYGVALANLVFLPIANKLKSHVQHEMSRREMLLNAWVSIARGDNPKLVSERLEAYLRLRES
ncbi:chemotaxis protein MotA [Methylophilus rhizosphaerae]|uniref:Chemotaxis protein MotA n=1 Tax=Methylophilus rhizosphaerae TaxID=492660 RepID=A0A1G9ASS7_9PROT|nr:flagellar motor protein [Methylophilus rhizosphaerae]SDK30356.1 chemotaxis protein MotA [Methylophilus rhizosphaerae]